MNWEISTQCFKFFRVHCQLLEQFRDRQVRPHSSPDKTKVKKSFLPDSERTLVYECAKSHNPSTCRALIGPQTTRSNTWPFTYCKPITITKYHHVSCVPIVTWWLSGWMCWAQEFAHEWIHVLEYVKIAIEKFTSQRRECKAQLEILCLWEFFFFTLEYSFYMRFRWRRYDLVVTGS